jgi:hypothetical protein
MNVIFIVLYLLRKCCASKYDVYFDTKLPEMHINLWDHCADTGSWIRGLIRTYEGKYGYLRSNTDICLVFALRANNQHCVVHQNMMCILIPNYQRCTYLVMVAKVYFIWFMKLNQNIYLWSCYQWHNSIIYHIFYSIIKYIVLSALFSCQLCLLLILDASGIEGGFPRGLIPPFHVPMVLF